ncbi:cobalt transport protein CbiN [Gottschalkia acidurici 9a]|uniref:Cobalt transport protein CbiN n=1 Tax=Gottschalkia acidurici (strain ATCC 7906 / DSM 604 / BCRC 14475 / CIP 104303 / KCTC 5404 / NCIMB 10678 / 9a) TaxID=1128398 RepID=K0B1Z7_GOTA9|nr:energy-coupling factor ABC transporter substrate-binding protein [Gottschalkia acidurici]AFS79489.1 cobalt transport protein CbiN [Gottschalkia acidurici 9a]
MKNNALLVILLVVILVVSLQIGAKNGPLEGADGIAMDEIENYEPWFEPIWEPPSGEVESGIFAFQAAIGGVLLGYFIGKKKNAKNTNELCKTKSTL